LQVGIDADAEQNVVARDRAAVVDRHGLHAPTAADAGYPTPQQQLDAVCAMQIGEPASQVAPDHAFERRRRRLDDRGLDARLARRRGGLLSDEAGADREQPRPRHEGRPEPGRILAGS
jgi:hypothetical protein